MYYYKATRSYVETFVSALSQRTDIEFVEGDKFGVNLKDKVFMYDPIMLQKASVDEVKGVLIHEVGHLNYTSIIDKKESKEYTKYPMLASLYNACEDIRIEHLMIKEFGDFARYPIGESRLYGTESNYFSIQDGLHLQMTPYQVFAGGLMSYMIGSDLQPLINLGNGGYLPYSGDVQNYVHDYLNILFHVPGPKKTIGQYIQQFNVKDLIRDIDNCRDTHEVVKMVDTKIVPLIRDLLEDEKKNQKAEAEAEAMHGALQEFKKGLEELGKELKKLKGSRGLLEDLANGKRAGKEKGIQRNGDFPPDEVIESTFKLQSYVLERHLRAILQDETTIKYGGNYKRGKLISKNIFKVRTQERRLYSKRNNPDTPQYEVTFMIDESGSMGKDGRYQDAYTAAYIIDMACKRLKFKINYIGFDGGVYEYKKLSRDYHDGGTDFVKPLNTIIKKINPDNHNIVFIITDGSGSAKPDKQLEKLKKSGVSVIPIGIGLETYEQTTFKQFLPQAVFAKDMESLTTTMISYIKTIIHR